MKQVFRKFPFLVIAAMLAVPASLMAQDKKDKEAKEKKEAEQIIITRKGDNDGKVVIEVNGDKITVNGKEVKEGDDDITVRRHKIKDVWAFGGDGLTGTWNNGDNNILRYYSMGENRALLGVTTNQADKGAEIENVTEGSAAEKAGLKKGDIIKTVNDRKIETPDDLSKEIKEHKPGDKVTITFLRDKKEQKVTAELGKWNGVSTFSFTPNHNFDMNMDFEHIMPKIQGLPRAQSWNWSGGGPKLGVSVQDTEDGNGVNVIDVDEDGNAARAGIKEDDIITEVDGKAVKSADEVARIIRESKEKGSVKIKLQRKGKTETVEVKIPKKLKTADL